MQQLCKERMQAMPSVQGKRKPYYLSAEFLIGSLLTCNLINLGLYDIVAEELKVAGKNIDFVEEAEPELSLGNGGLGRLAACFLDSIVTLNLPGDGVGLCYHYGLFEQTFYQNKQFEQPNPWLEPKSWLKKKQWSLRCPLPMVRYR